MKAKNLKPLLHIACSKTTAYVARPKCYDILTHTFYWDN